MKAQAKVTIDSDANDESTSFAWRFLLPLSSLPPIPIDAKSLYREDKLNRFLRHSQFIMGAVVFEIVTTGLFFFWQQHHHDQDIDTYLWILWVIAFVPSLIAVCISFSESSRYIAYILFYIGLLSAFGVGMPFAYCVDDYSAIGSTSVAYFVIFSCALYLMTRLSFKFSISLAVTALVSYLIVVSAGGYYHDSKQFALIALLFIAVHTICFLVAFQLERVLRKSFLLHQKSVKVIKDWRMTDRSFASKKLTVDPPVQYILTTLTRIVLESCLPASDKESLGRVMKLLRSQPALFTPFSRGVSDRYEALLNPEAQSLLQSLVGIEFNDLVACVVSDPTGPPINHRPPGSSRSDHRNPRDSMIFEDALDLSEECYFDLLTHRIDSEGWNINIIDLAEQLDNRPLYYLSIFLGLRFNIFDTLGIDIRRMKNFVTAVEERYQRNPYHNAMHAADVLFSICHWSRFLDKALFDPMDIFCLIVAAIVHDVDHDGKTNMFHVASESPRALLHNDRSVQENHHLAVAFELMSYRDKNILRSFTTSEKRRIRETVIELVLATDMSIHFQVLALLKTRVTNGELDMSSKDDRMLLMKMLLKSSDIGHVSKRLDIHLLWTNRLVDEFYLQGDEEKKQLLPVSTYMDREKPMVDRSQVGFLDVIAIPLLQTVTEAVLQSQPQTEGGNKVFDPAAVRLPLGYTQSNREEWFRRMTSTQL